MELQYVSTRNAAEQVTASQAILKGLAKEGGLFVPTEIPSLDTDLDDLAKMPYQEERHCIACEGQRSLLSGTLSWFYDCF